MRIRDGLKSLLPGSRGKEDGGQRTRNQVDAGTARAAAKARRGVGVTGRGIGEDVDTPHVIRDPDDDSPAGYHFR